MFTRKNPSRGEAAGSALAWRLGTLAGGLLLLAACAGGSAPSTARSASTSVTAEPTPTAPPSPSVTVADIRAVGQKIFAGPHPAGCNWSDRAACPVTDRLAARLTEMTRPIPNRPGPFPPICRCQNVPAVAALVEGELTPTGGIAHVTLGVARFDLIVVNQDGRLLVDDVQCGGRGPSTSVYAPTLVLCAA